MSTVTNTIITMLIIVAVGFVAGRIGLIPAETSKKLSDILMFLINPVLIFTSYQREYNSGIAEKLLIASVTAVVIHIIMIVAATFIIPKKNKNYAVERVAAVFGNCSFFGIPLVQGIYGSDGIIFLAMYVTVFNILAWTWGVTQMSGKGSFTDTLRHLVTPIVIAVVTGVIFFFTRVTVPEWLMKPMILIGDANTPLAMLVAGATLAGTNILKLLTKFRILLPNILRLVLFPALFAVLLAVAVNEFALPDDIIRIILIAASCPVAVITITFAHQHGKDSVYASEIFAVSTALCALTIPLVIKLFDFMLGVV